MGGGRVVGGWWEGDGRVLGQCWRPVSDFIFLGSKITADGDCSHEIKRCLLFGVALPCSSDGKESACNVGDLGLIPGLGRSPGEGNSSLLQYSCLENPMDRGAWQATKSQRVGHD